MAHNANGTVAKFTDAKATITTYAYGSDGDLTKIDNPAPLGDVTFGYDTLGRRTTITDGNGKTATLSYDSWDRLTDIKYGEGWSAQLTYDERGNDPPSMASGLILNASANSNTRPCVCAPWASFET